MITLDENSDGRKIELTKGQELEVVLPANRTTGYQWRLETSAEPALAAQGDTYAAPGAAASGGAGTHCWRFRAENAGRGTISLALRRPWETKGAADRTFRVEVHVPQG